MRIDVEKIHIYPKSRQLSAEWSCEAPQVMQAQYGVGDIPYWLDVIFGWGRFGNWLRRKTFKLRTRWGWLDLEEHIVDTLAAEIRTEVDREIIEKLRNFA